MVPPLDCRLPVEKRGSVSVVSVKVVEIGVAEAVMDQAAAMVICAGSALIVGAMSSAMGSVCM